MEIDTLKNRLAELAISFHGFAVKRKESLEATIRHMRQLGDERTREGNMGAAGMYHAIATEKMQDLAQVLQIIDDLDYCPVLGVVITSIEDPETRWTPAAVEHRGGGEGDAGLPPIPEDAANLTSSACPLPMFDGGPVGMLHWRDQEAICAAVAAHSTATLVRPDDGGWDWSLRTAEGEERTLAGDLTAREIWGTIKALGEARSGSPS